MASIKCAQCGLLNWASDTHCKRCRAALGEQPQTPPHEQRQTPFGAAPGARGPHDGGRAAQPPQPAGFVAAQVRRCTRNLALTGGALVLAVAVAAGLNARYLYNFVTGPQTIGRIPLLQARDADTLTNYYVTVRGDDVYDTGMRKARYKQRNGVRTGEERVEATYQALAVGDRLLLVEAPADAPVLPEQTGELVNIPPLVHQKVLEAVYGEEPNMRGDFLPVMLKTGDFRGRGLVGIGVGLTVLLVGLWCLYAARRRHAAPATHPIMTALAKYGPPADVAAAIDAEVSSPHATEVGPVRLTPGWFLHGSAFALNARPLTELVWGYKKVTKHYYNFVPTGKTYAVILHDRRGQRMEMQLGRGEQKADQTLAALGRYAPWLLFGYSEDLRHAWDKNRAEVLQVVDERRAEYQQHAAA
ncbi:MAG TPA: DUF6709 family protein [Pyrinomonadaceae bacterium]|jgi:hypothetical protein